MRSACYTPLLAHDPDRFFHFFVGTVLLIALLHALWYWLVGQVGFMLAAIGSRVERRNKILLPLVLVPVAGVVTVYVALLTVFMASNEVSDLWSLPGVPLLVVFLLVLPYVIGHYMLGFSRRRSIFVALCQTEAYGVVPFGMGLVMPPENEEPVETLPPASVISGGEMDVSIPAGSL